MLVNPDRIESLRQVFATPEERSRSHGEFEQIKKSLLANTGIDYSRDIQPWIGDEITLALTDLDFDRDSSKRVSIEPATDKRAISSRSMQLTTF